MEELSLRTKRGGEIMNWCGYSVGCEEGREEGVVRTGGKEEGDWKRR